VEESLFRIETENNSALRSIDKLQAPDFPIGLPLLVTLGLLVQVMTIMEVFNTGMSISETVLLWLLNFFSKQIVVRSLEIVELISRNKQRAK
jgi:hypothetical protein